MEQTKICGSKLKKAQHIVELALLAPFIMFFVGIVYQIAITVHTNYKFNSSLYEAISFIALTNKISYTDTKSKDDTVEDIKKYAQILLDKRHTPDRNSLNIKLVNAGNIDFLIGLYRYTSTFKIFNGMNDFNPESYNYLTVIPVNSAVLKRNSYNISNDFFENFCTIAPKEEQPPDNEETEEETTEEITETEEESSTSDTANNIEIPEVQF